MDFRELKKNPVFQIAQTWSNINMFANYLTTGLTVLFIYYFWPPKGPYEMDPIVLSNPSIGISLTASYGVMSIRHSDGSFEDIGRVEADTDYIEMMKRLSSRAACHPCEPYGDLEEMWQDTPRQIWMSFRKKIGLAASSDVKTISKLVKKLLTLNKSASLPYVVISYPAIPALYKEDMNNMAEYLGLPKLKGLYEFHPWEVYAAYAGHGLGLCEHIENEDQCTEEGRQLPLQETILVEYTDQAILLYPTVLRDAISVNFGSAEARATSSFALGANTRADKHVSRVGEFVYQYLSHFYRISPPTGEALVIMTGIANETIAEAVREAVERVLPRVRILTSNSEFVASRGSAELAWRVNLMAST